MRTLIYVLTLTILLFSFSCQKDLSPISTEQQNNIPICGNCGCDTAGIYINFVDTCSYDFVISFLAEYDSVIIIDTHLGVDLFLYADSGNSAYWFDYFKDDSLFFSLSSFTRSDSLFLIIRFLNEEYYQNYKDDLTNHRNLYFENFIIHENSVLIQVPKNSESFWINYFSQYVFIEYVDLLVSCWGG